MLGETGGRVAETSVSTLLVLAAILTAFVPFAGPSNPAAAAQVTVVVSGRTLSFSTESFGSAAPVVSSVPPTGVNFDYVLTIMLENKAICDILTSCNGSAPYLTSLAAASGLATHYHGCISPSLGNYLCITSGSTFGCTADSLPNASACTREAWNATNLVDRLVAANLTWKSYQENMPSDCFAGNQYPYAAKHNPFVYYKDIATNATRCARDVPSGTSNQLLLSDLGSTTTASNYMWYTPNLCHDMHDCNVTAGDTFLSGLVPQILNSTVFQTQRAALLITFDEDGGGRGSPDLYTVWAGPAVKHGFQSNVPYDHYSALRTIEANWNLAPLTANDTAAVPMNEFFPGLPTARFVTSPTWPKGNTTVTFNGSSSSSDVPNATLQYRWDWTDDGTWDTNWSATPTATHVYGSSGLYTAALQVQDIHGTNKTTHLVAADDLPPVTNATLSGTLGQNGWYRGNVTITLNATDDRSGVWYTTYHLDGSAVRTYVNPIVVTGDGLHTLTYHSVDRAGNSETHKDATFQKDGTAPATAVAFSGTVNGSQFLTPILVTLSATDAFSGVARTVSRVDGGPVTNYTLPFLVSNVGSHVVQYDSIDVAGNIEPTNSFSVVNGTITNVSLLSRAVLSGTAGSSGWYTSAVTATLELVNGTSPPDSIGYRLDGGAWTVYAQPFVVTGDGVHSLDFNATNGLGLNEATHHVVIRVDTTPPVSRSTLSGTLGNDSWYISAVKVVLNATDNTSGVANLSYRIDGGPWSLYVAPFFLNEGRHTLDYHATDVAGLSDLGHSASVKIDTTKPVSTAAASGTAGNNGWYVTPATLVLNASDLTSGVAHISYRIDGGPWQTYSVPFVLSDGVHDVEYNATDNAGLTETTKSLTVKVDTVAPVTTASLSGTSGSLGWFVSAVTVSLNATDATSGVANITYRVDGGMWMAYAGPFVLGEGRHAVDFYATDLAGVVEAMVSRTVLVDTTPPATTSNLSGTSGHSPWYVSSVTVYLNATDVTSGVAGLVYRVDGGNWTTYTGPFTLADGVHLLEYYATDVAGLVESTKSRTVSIDTVPPTTTAALSGTAGANGWFVSAVTVSLNATDATSGVANVSYRIDGGAWLAYGGPFVVGQGVHTVDYFSLDLAGVTEAIHSQTIQVDTTPPATTATLGGTTGANGWYTSNVTVSLSASDAESGIAHLYVQVDGGGWVIYAGAVTLTDGTHVVTYYAVNNAGLPETVHSVTIRVDTAPPTTSVSLSGTLGANGWYTSNVTVSLTATDATSGVANITYRVDGGTWFVYTGPFALTEGSHVLDYFSVDLAGLTEATHSQIIAIDMTPPSTTASVSGTAGANGWYVSSVIVSLSASDPESGIANVYVRVDGGDWAVYTNPVTIMDGTHVVDYYAVNIAGLSEASHSVIVLVDTVPPATAISLSGTPGANGWYTSNVTVSLAATDATSGVATSSYRIDGGSWFVYTGPFVLGTGSHVVDYFSGDVAGLTEGTHSQSIAIDTTPPSTTDSVSGTTGANGWYVSNVTVSLSASDSESGIDNVYVRVDGGGWAVYTSPVTVTDGTHLLEYYAVNNAGLAETSHSVPILVDTNPPTTFIWFSGTRGANGWYTSNVTVALNATDATSGVATTSYRIDGGTWLAYTGPFVLGDGQHVVDYFSIDLAGLPETMHSQTIAIDTTPPSTTASVSGTAGANGWYVTTVAVSLSATDPGSGISNVYTRIDGGDWQVYSGPVTVTDGTHVFEFYAVNGAGLFEGTHSLSLAVDTTPPASSISLAGTAGANGWYVSNVTVSLSASDATSGVANISYRVDGGAWLSYAGPFVLGEGSHAVDYFASDQAGLAEAAHTTTIAVDLTPPTTTASVSGTAGANGWYVSNVMARLSASDSGSGVANIYVQLDGGNWAIYAGPVTLTEGTHIVGYFAVDHAGLIEATHSLSISVDTAPPTTTSSLSGTAGTNGWYTSNVTVSLTATDATSGVAAVNYRIDNGSWLVYAGPIVLGEGRHLLEYGASDIAGNLETVHARSIEVDTSPPISYVALAGTPGDNGWYVTAVSATLTATDATSGVAIIYYRIDGGPWATYAGPLTLAEGRHVLTFRATDRAGNIEVDRSVTVLVDTTPPVSSALLEGSLGDNGWYRSNVTVSLRASDATSGVAQISYRTDNGPWLAYTDAFVLTNGQYAFEYFATDAAGIGEPTHTMTIQINTIAPITTASVSGTVGENGWYTSSVFVTLTASDGTGGVDDIFYRVDGGSWIVYTGPIVLGEGRRVLEYYATDGAGNLEPGHSRTLSIDTTPPVASASLLGTVGANNWYTSNVSVTLDATDATSGVAEVRYRVDGGSWQSYAGPFLLESGRHTIDMFAIDLAGLSGSVQTRTINIDTVGPATVDTISGTSGADGWYLSAVTVTLSPTDSVSGVASTVYRIDGGAWVAYTGPFAISQGGTHLLEFASLDTAGNRGPNVRDSVSVETSGPYFISLSGSADGTALRFRIIWSAADNDSGIARYELRLDDGPFVSQGTATSAMLNLTVGPHEIQVKAFDRAGQSTVRSLSIQVLSATGIPFGSLLVLVAPLLIGTVAAFAFLAWRIRRHRKEKSP
ncbi:MAG: hypothetical protein E6K12_01905 [Methanobacteriota archaeon]|nr:MAG: hypothetical protein E6K12_01905 [Euryarchaeota archaeon]